MWFLLSPFVACCHQSMTVCLKGCCQVSKKRSRIGFAVPQSVTVVIEAVPGTRPFFPEILLVAAQEKLLNTLPSTAPHHRAFSCLCLFCFCRLILLGFSKLLLGFSKLLLGFSKLLAWFRTLLLEDPHPQEQHTNSSSDSTKGVDPVNVIHPVHIQRSPFGAELFSFPFTMQPAPIAEGGCEEGPSSWPGQPRYCSS